MEENKGILSEKIDNLSNSLEKILLEELSKRHIMKKDEIINFLKTKVDNPKKYYSDTVNNLIAKGYAKHIIPIGESVIAITQKGIREVEE